MRWYSCFAVAGIVVGLAAPAFAQTKTVEASPSEGILADVNAAEKEGKPEKALELCLNLFLSGKQDPELRERIRILFRKVNQIERLRDATFLDYVLSLKTTESLALYSEALTKIHTLYADRTKATFDKLYAAGLTELELLSLGRTGVSDAGLKELSGLTKMARLDLSGTKVTGVGFKALEPMTGLKALVLTRAPVADAGLKSLQAFPKLADLHLDGTKITDAGLGSVAACPSLSYLFVQDTAVTDVGLRKLKPLDKLTEVNATGTKVTKKGAEDLKEALPKCKVITK